MLGTHRDHSPAPRSPYSGTLVRRISRQQQAVTALPSPTLEQIRAWADTLLLDTEVVDVSDNSDFAWACALKPPQGASGIDVFVGHFVRDSANHVTLQARIGVTDNHALAVSRLGTRTSRIFLYDLQLALLQPPLELAIEIAPNEDTGLQIVVDFALQLIGDNINPATLYDGFVRFQSAFGILTMTLNKVELMESWP